MLTLMYRNNDLVWFISFQNGMPDLGEGTSSAMIKTEPSINDLPAAPVPTTSYALFKQMPNSNAQNQVDEKPATVPMVTISSAGSNYMVALDEQKRHDANEFAKYVLQRLCRQPDDLKRRRLENSIQEAIAKTEKELF